NRRRRRADRRGGRPDSLRVPVEPGVLLQPDRCRRRQGTARPRVPHRRPRRGRQRQARPRSPRGAVRRHRHRDQHAGRLPRQPSGPLPRRQGRRRGGPGRTRRRVPREPGARKARRELHAAGSRACARAGAEGRQDRDNDEMIAELGHFALALALGVALAMAILPLAGAARGNARWMRFARPAAAAQFFLVATAFCALAWSFAQNDFSVAYVAQNSNSKLPLQYRLSAVWGGHEGSLLLWILMLSGWTLAVALASRSLPETLVARTLGVLGLVGAGFHSFILFTSNPFERLAPTPNDGGALHPPAPEHARLLQTTTRSTR